MTCSRETKTCEVTHDYTPLNDCCKKIILDTLQYLCKKLEENNIHYWLDYGTLLGAIRDKKFIPWDRDADIGILEEDVFKLKVLFPEFIEDGYLPTNNKLKNGLDSCHLQLYASPTNNRHVCIFAWYKDGNMLRRSNYIGMRSEVGTDAKKGGDFPFEWVESRTIVDFENNTYYAPLYPIKMCIHRYGDKWQTPLNVGDWNRTNKETNLISIYNSPKFKDKLEIAQILSKSEVYDYSGFYSLKLCDKGFLLQSFEIESLSPIIFKDENIILFENFKIEHIEQFERFLDTNLIPYKILAKTEDNSHIVMHILS